MLIDHITALLALDPVLVPLQEDDNPLLVILFLGGFGAVAMYGGWRRYQTSRIIANTPTEKVRSMAVGRTELEGEAWPRDEPFDQPFADGKAVLASYKIEEYEQDDDGSNWKTRDSGTMAVPFFLDDGTGRALIDADSSVQTEISGDNTTQLTVGQTEEEPAAIKEFLEQESSLDVPSSGLGGVVFGEKRRYTQRVIPPGEGVYVFGDAETTDVDGGSNEELLVINEDDATGRFIVSDKGEDELSSDLGRSALLVLALGVLLLTGAFYMVLVTFVFAG